jgi:uncharacterized protein (TIGR02246 family)
MGPSYEDTPDEPANVEVEIRALYKNLLESWNRRKATEMAALFAVDGSIVGFDGSQMNGQGEIAASLGQIFAEHMTAAYVGKVREVRLLSTEVALVRAVVGMVPPGQSDLNPAKNALQTLIAVKHTGQWRIALFQNTPAQFHGRPDLAGQMTDELRQLLPHSLA